MDSNELLRTLSLQPLDEGGFYRETYRSSWEPETPDRTGGSRSGMTTIFYALDAKQPLAYLHRNRSDIIHFFHSGGPIEYWVLSPAGALNRHVLGPDPRLGHVFQLFVPGGYWKASRLLSEEYGLLSEAVVPGFDWRDRDFADRELLAQKFPMHLETLLPFLASETSEIASVGGLTTREAEDHAAQAQPSR